ncbi:DUF805 domain-containing protein [Algicella marina]|uniref:DUF805 domain-containing protein n=1 Tax=Algicella marina TaxID=2683284 RepID=A0A6P1SZG6_9RHOB|nr:DUF805 domain-containing protein [Algicella marina]QHQ34616.1 hypothetical protein GO499_05130 [Algicella marina]
MNNIGLPGLLVAAVMLAVLLLPYWKLWARAGHSGWWCVLMAVPVVNIVSLWVLAFKRWPAEDARFGGAGRVVR